MRGSLALLSASVGLFGLNMTLAARGETQSAVYDDDNRVDMYDVADGEARDWQRSVAAMVDTGRIRDGVLIGQPLTANHICPSVRFSNQVSVSKCTGFLVGDDILVTAGHCMSTPEDCTKFSWVFGFANYNSEQASYPAPSSEVYGCKQVIERKMTDFGAIDHAVIQLDRPVANRPPLPIRVNGGLNAESTFAMIGHPVGLPAKAVPGGKILENSHPNFFATDIDTFGGNSGSPVFDEATGMVEGIMNRGHADYVWNDDATCKIIKVCRAEDRCNTARAVRMTNIDYFRPRLETAGMTE